MRIISLNVNGIRSAVNKGLLDWMEREIQPDIICMQEVKALSTDLHADILSPSDYHLFLQSASKKGYSGVATYIRKTLASKTTETSIFNEEAIDSEGRFLRIDLEKFSIISVYFPSGTSGEERQAFKYMFMDTFYNYLKQCFDEYLTTGRDFIFCGDWNIAHTENDIKNWKGNLKNSGFLPEERAWLTKVFSAGWVDVYRQIHPTDQENSYTWWSNRGQARANNVGWRIDYQIATPSMAKTACRAFVYTDTRFSDHAPLIIDYQYS